MSFVSSTELQQYPARGPVFFAVGTDFGKLSTFSQSVFNMVKGTLLCAGMVGKDLGVVMGIDGIEEGLGM
jgi:hypothetical protein